jgi:pimeloyl-ACP methyl ester carboxylesterase
VVLMARPGMHGSSGNHARDRHSVEEVELLDGALTALRQRYGFRDFALFGFSSGGPVVANLLARRDDIRCAVIGSAPLDLALFYQRHDGMTPDYFAMRNGQFADPMRTVRGIRSHAPVFVIGDSRDRSVPASAWESWVAAARRAGLHVHSAEIAGLERPELGGTVEMHHQTSSRGMEVAHACATGTPEDRVLRALRSGEPILLPRGRRLSGPEIRAAFAGRSVRGTEWYPRANVSSHWAADGVLSYLDLRRGERRIGEWRWHVEGDRLCTTRHGCGEVFEDGRFLHLVRGDPPHLRITFVTAPPDTAFQTAGRS